MLCPIYVRLMSGNFQGYFYHRTTLMCDPPPIHAQVQYVTSVSHKEWLNSHLKLLFNVPKLYKLNWKIKQNHKSGHTHHNFSPYLSSLQNFSLGKLNFKSLFKIGLFMRKTVFHEYIWIDVPRLDLNMNFVILQSSS